MNHVIFFATDMPLLDQKTRAQLKRYAPSEVPGAYAWATTIQCDPRFSKVSIGSLLDAAAVVSIIRDESPLPLGRLMKAADVSEARVRRLLASDREDICDLVKRMIRVIGCKANPGDIAFIVTHWGDGVRRRIAMDYFGSSEGEE